MILTTYQKRTLSYQKTEILDYQEDTTMKNETKVYSIGHEEEQNLKKNVISSTYGKYVYRDISLSEALLHERETEKEKEERHQ